MANKSSMNTFALNFQTNDPDFIFSQLYDVLSDSLPLSKAFQKPQEAIVFNPSETRKKLEHLFTLNIKHLSHPHRVNIIARVINKLESLPNLTTQQSSHLIQLQALHVLVDCYTSAVSTMSSADDFVKSRAAAKTQLLRSAEDCAHAKEAEKCLQIELAKFQTLLEDVDNRLAALHAQRHILSFSLDKKVGEVKKGARSKKELDSKTQLLMKDLKDYTKTMKLWEKERAKACDQVEKIEREWESIRSSFLRRS